MSIEFPNRTRDRHFQEAGADSLLAQDDSSFDTSNPTSTIACFLCTKNLKALWGLFLLNTAFAVCQLIAAFVANSVSMMSDSGSMLVDSFTYSVAIIMERRKMKYGLEASKVSEALCSLLSVCLLILVTSITLSNAVHRLNSPEINDNETVSGGFVMGFSIANLFVDFLMCGNYWFQQRVVSEELTSEKVTAKAKELNMVAAFVHLLADTLRSVTGVIAGAFELNNHDDSVRIDSFATFFVGFAILLAASFVLFQAISQFREARSQAATQQQRDMSTTTALGEI